jgi:CHAT domain
MKRILILSANPINTDRLRLDEEVREIEEGLKLSKYREQFQIIPWWAVRVDDLRRALLETEPSIVHFSGHGAGSHGLALENNAGKMQLVSTESLAGLFKLHQRAVECILLNACYSEEQAQAIHQHIDCVIGMNNTIKDTAALSFAKGFYEALGSGRSYEEAYQHGCNNIDLNSIPESSVPVIKTRNASTPTVNKPSNKQMAQSMEPPPSKENPSHSMSFNGSQISGGNFAQTSGFNQTVSGSNISGGVQALAGSGNQATQTGNVMAPVEEKQLTQAEVVSLLTQIEQLAKGAELPEEIVEEVIAYLGAAKKAVAREQPNKKAAQVNLQSMTETIETTSKTVSSAKSLWDNIKPILMQLPAWLGVAKNFFG